MGSTFAADLSELQSDGDISLDTSLAVHFQHNHYPPLPLSLIPVAKRVIITAQAGGWGEEVKLPEGITYRGSEYAPVRECVQGWHLSAWIDDDVVF